MNDDSTNCPTAENTRIQLFAFVAAAVIAVVFGLCFSSFGIACDGAAQKMQLECRINPNDAPLASLMRLPNVGRTRAQEIINYRRQLCYDGKANLAFRDCSDLDKVKGIGPATTREMCEWLIFR